MKNFDWKGFHFFVPESPPRFADHDDFTPNHWLARLSCPTLCDKVSTAGTKGDEISPSIHASPGNATFARMPRSGGSNRREAEGGSLR
jgi:hypothetical protein